jgi:hypothetical protein
MLDENAVAGAEGATGSGKYHEGCDDMFDAHAKNPIDKFDIRVEADVAQAWSTCVVTYAAQGYVAV